MGISGHRALIDSLALFAALLQCADMPAMDNAEHSLRFTDERGVKPRHVERLTAVTGSRWSWLRPRRTVRTP